MSSLDKRMIYLTEPTRDHIIDIATTLFTNRGFFETHMRDIAQASDLSRTSLYRYFRDKLDLGFAILERIWTRFEASTPWPPEGDVVGMNGLERIRIHLRTRWLSSDLRPLYTFMAEFDAYFSGQRLPADFKDRIRPSMKSTGSIVLLALIKEGMEDGSVRPDLDPHLAMVTILNALRGLQQRIILRSEALIELEEGEDGRVCDELVRYLCSGIANHG